MLSLPKRKMELTERRFNDVTMILTKSQGLLAEIQKFTSGNGLSGSVYVWLTE
jgi:hypothetical protein